MTRLRHESSTFSAACPHPNPPPRPVDAREGACSCRTTVQVLAPTPTLPRVGRKGGSPRDRAPWQVFAPSPALPRTYGRREGRVRGSCGSTSGEGSQELGVMIFNTIKNGCSGTLMSPFRDAMNDEQIWKLVRYLRDENRKRKEGN